jgi:hypothetical protein
LFSVYKQNANTRELVKSFPDCPNEARDADAFIYTPSGSVIFMTPTLPQKQAQLVGPPHNSVVHGEATKKTERSMDRPARERALVSSTRKRGRNPTARGKRAPRPTQPHPHPTEEEEEEEKGDPPSETQEKKMYFTFRAQRPDPDRDTTPCSTNTTLSRLAAFFTRSPDATCPSTL